MDEIVQWSVQTGICSSLYLYLERLVLTAKYYVDKRKYIAKTEIPMEGIRVTGCHCGGIENRIAQFCSQRDHAFKKESRSIFFLT